MNVAFTTSVAFPQKKEAIRVNWERDSRVVMRDTAWHEFAVEGMDSRIVSTLFDSTCFVSLPVREGADGVDVRLVKAFPFADGGRDTWKGNGDLSAFHGMVENYTPEGVLLYVISYHHGHDVALLRKRSREPSCTPSYNLMADHYIGIMGHYLRNFDGDKTDNYEIKYYNALAWGGLEKTVAYRDKKPEEKSTIETHKDHLISGRPSCR